MDAATAEHVTKNNIIQLNKIICTMGYRYRMSQDELAYTYEHAQVRMDAHPEYADKQKQIIQAQSFFKNEKEALQAAIEQRKDNQWGTVEDVGFNNVEDVINQLMKNLPETIPSRSMVQIRIENKDKKQTKDYTRMV